MAIKPKDFTGNTYGKLIAVKNTMKKSKRGAYLWEVICECGNSEEREPFILAQSLKGGNTPVCKDCAKRLTSERSSTHKGTDDWLYKRWVKIRRRCNNPEDKDFIKYGALGVRIDDEFLDYGVFRNYLTSLENYNQKFTIDRIDPSKGYQRGNLRWATSKQQSRNLTFSEKESGLPVGVRKRERNGTIYYRAGWVNIEGKVCEKSFSARLEGEELALFAATEYRELMIERLNQLGAGYSEYHGTIKETI